MLEFKNVQFLSCRPACRPAVLLPHTKFCWNRTICLWFMAKKNDFSRWRPPPSWILKISIFGHVAVTGFNIWCSVPNFIEIGRFFSEIWRFNDFQNGGPLPCWILKICSFCHIALVDLPFCFVTQNFAEIERLVDDSWQKSDFQDGGCRHLEFQKFQFLVTCLSVCLSVRPTRSWITSKRINISSKFLHRRVATPF